MKYWQKIVLTLALAAAFSFPLVNRAAMADDSSATTPGSANPANSTPTPPASATGSLVIIAQARKTSYNPGEPITVDVLIRNSTDNDFTIGGSAFDLSSFRVIALNPRSHAIPLTAYGKTVLALPSKVKKNDPVTIQSGYQRHYVFDLKQMFGLHVPGTYSVIFKRIVVVSQANLPGHRHEAPNVLALVSDPLAIMIAGTPPPQVNADVPPTVSKWEIAFVRNGDIWIGQGQGGDEQLIIRNGQEPCWSRDKSLIAFSRGGNVWVADPDGQNQRQLTQTQAYEAGVNPVFSPDGQWIAYRAWTSDGGAEIRIVSVDGKVDKPFVEDGEAPAW